MEDRMQIVSTTVDRDRTLYRDYPFISTISNMIVRSIHCFTGNNPYHITNYKSCDGRDSKSRMKRGHYREYMIQSDSKLENHTDEQRCVDNREHVMNIYHRLISKNVIRAGKCYCGSVWRESYKFHFTPESITSIREYLNGSKCAIIDTIPTVNSFDVVNVLLEDGLFFDWFVECASLISENYKPQTIIFMRNSMSIIPCFLSMLHSLELPFPERIINLRTLHFIPKSLTYHNVVLNINELMEHYPPEAVRWYFSRMDPLSTSTQTMNFGMTKMRDYYNREIIQLFLNLLKRTFQLVQRTGGMIPDVVCEEEVYNEEIVKVKMYEAVKEGRLRIVTDEIVNLVRTANKYYANGEPWKMARDESQRDEMFRIIRITLERLYLCSLLLAPFVPQISRQSIDCFNQPADNGPVPILELKQYNLVPVPVSFTNFTNNHRDRLF